MLLRLLNIFHIIIRDINIHIIKSASELSNINNIINALNIFDIHIFAIFSH